VKRITLLTDFGTADGYVAAVKGVMATLVTDALFDDASHDIAQGDVRAAAWALGGYWQLYPAGTVHVVVVDPGVGSDRRALACNADGRFLVAPDNGVLTRVLHAAPDAHVVAITNAALLRPEVSTTFHGRDVFAPAAAHLAQGGALDDLGPRVADAVVLPERSAVQEPHGCRGTVVHVDRYGNLVTNIPGDWVGIDAAVRIGTTMTRVVRTYSDVEPGDLLALTGSRGTLEISVRNGSALERVWLSHELEVHVTSAPGDATI
jgi:S-adenosyl-L-methionine hydrolase (adenosine-forming)